MKHHVLLAILFSLGPGATFAADQVYQCDGIWKQSFLMKLTTPPSDAEPIQYLKDEGVWSGLSTKSRSASAITVSSEGWMYSNEARRAHHNISISDASECATDAQACRYDIRFDLSKNTPDGKSVDVNYAYVASADCKRLEGTVYSSTCQPYAKGAVLGGGQCVKRDSAP